MLEISNSLEWPAVRRKLLSDIRSLNYNADLRKMLQAIDVMVTELSKCEVEARRTKNTKLTATHLKNINGAIVNLDQWIVMGGLLQ